FLLEIGAQKSFGRNRGSAGFSDFYTGLFETQSSAGQDLLVGWNQIITTAHIAREKLFETATGHQLTGFLKIRRRVIAVFLKKFRVEKAHHIVQRLAIIASPANLEIQQHPQQLALVVIRNLR